MSSRPSIEWEELWPEISAEVERKVRPKLPPGVEPSDVSNEVAARLLAAANVPPPDRVRFWCLWVARCVVADLYRRRPVRDRDLPLAASCDVEQVAMARLRLNSALDSFSRLSEADRDALTSTVTPMSDSLKARRKRARQVLRRRMIQSVGAAINVPRLRWVFASGAVAAAVPFCLAVPMMPPVTGSSPEASAGSEVQMQGPVRHQNAAEEQGTLSTPDGDSPTPAPRTSALVGGPEYREIVAADVPAMGRADAGRYDPGPEEGARPLACARNLRVTDDVCVDHPLR